MDRNSFTALIILALLEIIIPSAALYIQNINQNVSEIASLNNTDANNSSNICVSPQCIHSASEVLSKMKADAKPCDDFYQFACGKFIEDVAIPEDKEEVNTFTIIEDRVTEHLKNIITKERPPTDPKHMHLPNRFYKACMNTSRIEELGTMPITSISDALGGWPLIKGNAWDLEDKWCWQTTATSLRKFGIPRDGVFSTSIGFNRRNDTFSVLIGKPSLDINYKFLRKGFNDSVVKAFYEYMVDIAALFGANREKAKEELREVLEFEMSLANISMQEHSIGDLHRTLSIKQLQQTYPYVQWLDYVNGKLPEDMLVDEDEIIVVSVPSFFVALGPLLDKTPKRVIANYMMWQIHSYAVLFLPEKFLKRNLRYKSDIFGVSQNKPRWQTCVDYTKESLYIAVGSLYVQKYIKADSKVIVDKMVKAIRSSFEDILSEVTWMDNSTKQEAKEKLNSMATHIGYPDELLDNTKLKTFYENLEIDPDKYFESILNVNSFSFKKAFYKLHLPVNTTDWTQSSIPADVNAFYSYTDNSLILPAGTLQGHIFNAERPMYMNYGAIGTLIGHEITHGFDDLGQYFDKKGKLIEWWQADTQIAFQKKVACIKEQYGNYTDNETGLNLNGLSNQSENIADNGGVKEAYKAYREWAASNGPEPKLPGLDFTPEQMFWITTAQVWCANTRKETVKVDIAINSHSPDKFRVIGSLRNMKDFSKDFQCPEGSPMNPVNKCEVW